MTITVDECDVVLVAYGNYTTHYLGNHYLNLSHGHMADMSFKQNLLCQTDIKDYSLNRIPVW